jgi:hypothetical protein
MVHDVFDSHVSFIGIYATQKFYKCFWLESENVEIWKFVIMYNPVFLYAFEHLIHIRSLFED